MTYPHAWFILQESGYWRTGTSLFIHCMEQFYCLLFPLVTPQNIIIMGFRSWTLSYRLIWGLRDGLWHCHNIFIVSRTAASSILAFIDILHHSTSLRRTTWFCKVYPCSWCSKYVSHTSLYFNHIIGFPVALTLLKRWLLQLQFAFHWLLIVIPSWICQY
jgi:hypothetical protein